MSDYKYEMDMSQEKKPLSIKLLPEGWRRMQIVDCKEETSKRGNAMFVFEFEDIGTSVSIKAYAIAEPKKRWFLKRILDACDIKAAKDGVYKWDIRDVMDKEVYALIEHEQNDWINRDGVTVKITNARIRDVIRIVDLTMEGETEGEAPFEVKK